MRTDRFINWSSKAYTDNQRLLAMIPAGIFFLIIMPAIFVWASNLDQRLEIPRMAFGPFGLVVGAGLIIIGFGLGFWSVYTEFEHGKGTPVPMMPTQKLVIAGPFRYCRNPMTLGTICGYLGVVVLVGSLSSLVLLLLLTAGLLTYIKLVEEKELADRFGPDYMEYRRTTPFIIPGRRRKVRP